MSKRATGLGKGKGQRVTSKKNSKKACNKACNACCQKKAKAEEEKEIMSEEKIQTLHPQGKTNKKIDRDKYETIKKAILSILKKTEPTHNELFEALNKNLKGEFSGNISWYGETVKLDLEARKIIERTSDKPQRYRIKK